MKSLTGAFLILTLLAWPAAAPRPLGFKLVSRPPALVAGGTHIGCQVPGAG